MKKIPRKIQKPIAVYVERSLHCKEDVTLYIIDPFSEKMYFMYFNELKPIVYQGNEGDEIAISELIDELNRANKLACEKKVPWGKILYWEYFN